MARFFNPTPTFNPISLEEYLHVPALVMNEYKESEKTYNETQAKAEALKALLGDRDEDNERGWQIVDKYNSMLEDAASAMLNKGIQGPDAYRQAKNAMTYYNQNMLLLEAALNAYKEDEKEAREFNKDGTLIRKKRYTINDFIGNPNLKSEYILGSEIQDEAKKAAKNASTRRTTGRPNISTVLGGQYHMFSTPTGFSPQEVQAWVNGQIKVPELDNIYVQIATKLQYDGYDFDDINQYLLRGIYDGVTYDNKIEYKENRAYDQEAKNYSGKTGNVKDDKDNIGSFFKSRPMINVSKENKIDSYIKHGILKQNDDGTISLNKEALSDFGEEDRILQDQSSIIPNYVVSYHPLSRKHDFIRKYDSRSEMIESLFKDLSKATGEIFTIENNDGNIIFDEDKVNAAINEVYGDRYDYQREFYFPIDISGSTDAKNAFSSLSGNISNLKTYSKGRHGLQEEKKLSSEEFNDENTKIRNIVSNGDNVYVELSLADGSDIIMNAPFEMRRAVLKYDNMIRDLSKRIKKFEDILISGQVSYEELKEIFPNVSDEQLNEIINNPYTKGYGSLNEAIERCQKAYNKQIADMLRVNDITKEKQ